MYDMANIERNVHHGKMAFPNGCFIGFWNLPKWKENGRKEKEMKWNGMELVFEYIIIFQYLNVFEWEKVRGSVQRFGFM